MEIKHLSTKDIKLELSKFVSYDRGEKLRRELKKRGKYFISVYTDAQLLSFIERTADAFDIETLHAQNHHEPYVYCLFTIRAQHVYGDSLKECVEKAIKRSRTKV